MSVLNLPPAVANGTKADFGDVDGNGDLDAIVANVRPEQLMLNNGNGVFEDVSATQLPPPAPFLQDITADARLADVDGDGDADILLSNENPFNPSPTGGGQNRLLINEGTGVFLDEAATRLPVATDQIGAMLPGDVDEDGDPDLIVLNRGQDFVLINSGAGVFRNETAARFPVTTDSSRGGGLVDLDADGDLDLVVANSRNEPIALYLNVRGVFNARDFGPTPGSDETNTGLELADRALSWRRRSDDRCAFGDIDGNGDLDLIVGNSGENGGERVFALSRLRKS